jgi:alcohol dehydrogenase (cytochrome c)
MTGNGETIPAAGEAGKVGWVFIVDRRTGMLIRKSDPYVIMSNNMFSTPTAAGVDMLPVVHCQDVEVVSLRRVGGWRPFSAAVLMHFTTKPAVSAPGLLRLGSTFTNVAPGGNFQMTYPLGDVVAIFKLPATRQGVSH